MTGIERVDPGFKLLAVVARMHGVADIVVPENGQACNGVADAIVGLTQGLLAKKTIGGRDKGVEAYIGDFTHPAKPHIAAPRDHASRQDVYRPGRSDLILISWTDFPSGTCVLAALAFTRTMISTPFNYCGAPDILDHQAVRHHQPQCWFE